MRARIPVLLAALFLSATVALGGCADGDGHGEASSAPATSGPPASQTTADLQVSIRSNGTEESSHYHLLCSGVAALPASEHPNADAACALVARQPQLLAGSKSRVDEACTMQYGGPAIAVVSGTLEGRAIERRFDRRDGCGISDWQSALPLLVDEPSGSLQ